MRVVRLGAMLVGVTVWWSAGIAAAQEGGVVVSAREHAPVATLQPGLIDPSIGLIPPPAPPAPRAAPASLAPIVPCSAPRRHRRYAMAGIALAYAATTSWAYFAWFRGATYSDFYFDRHPWFAPDVYSGGADKAGHLWANYALARITSELLVAGGWSRLTSGLVGSGMSLAFFTMSEIEDGFLWGFEIGDMVFNAAGAALSLLLVTAPKIDELIDLRIEYLPTREYRDSLTGDGNLDFAQDYSGQSYLLALHLDALPRLTDPAWLGWARYVDVVAGFETRNYTPVPYDEAAVPRQSVYLGVAVNMQRVLSALLPASAGRRVGNLAFEMISPPFTTVKFPKASRSPK